LRAYGIRSGEFDLPPARMLRDLREMKAIIGGLDLGVTRIVLTGGGRVAGGALEVLEAAGIRQVEPEAFLEEDYSEAVFTRLDPWHYARRRGGKDFDFGHFVTHPDRYENSFLPYAARADMFIACHFWDPRSPVMVTREALASGELPLKIIADISCDIDGPIASTIRASTIAEPFYGYDPVSGKETEPFREGALSVMAVDNLPGELPRDASADFGQALADHVIPELLGISDTGMLEGATIASGGHLSEAFAYLQGYLEGGE